MVGAAKVTFRVLSSKSCKPLFYTVGLEGRVECFNELSIFDLRPDIWIVCNGGVPIGVVEVKKTAIDNEDETLHSPFVQGQLFDYMLRLQSFFGLQHVFGILSTYEQWRICWMPRSERAAMATSASAPTHDPKDHEAENTHTVVPERVLHGSSKFFFFAGTIQISRACSVQQFSRCTSRRYRRYT
eukprot:scaffold112_cov196-Amphora_coffeaeformis.AAC.11